MDFHPELASAGFPSDLTLLTKHYRAEFDAFTQASCDGGHGFGYGSQDNTFLTLLDGTDLAGDGNDALEDDSCDEMDIFLSPPVRWCWCGALHSPGSWCTGQSVWW